MIMPHTITFHERINHIQSKPQTHTICCCTLIHEHSLSVLSVRAAMKNVTHRPPNSLRRWWLDKPPFLEDFPIHIHMALRNNTAPKLMPPQSTKDLQHKLIKNVERAPAANKFRRIRVRERAAAGAVATGFGLSVSADADAKPQEIRN